MTNAIYQGKDQNWQDEQTIYWFDLDGEQFGVVEGENAGIVDDESFPIEGRGDQREIENKLESAVTDEMRAE